MRLLLAASLILTTTTAPVLAQICNVDRAAVEARIAQLEENYSVLSDIGCESPVNPAHVLMCDSAVTFPDTLWRMGRLDTLAWVYAVENATGNQVDQDNPPLDADFIKRRDACTDEACLCEVLISHSNDSLGGTSPYPQ